jgi:hypothetical protein
VAESGKKLHEFHAALVSILKITIATESLTLLKEINTMLVLSIKNFSKCMRLADFRTPE